jgi:hypothetical protein
VVCVRVEMVEAIGVVEEEWSLRLGFYSKPRSEGGNWHMVVIVLESLKLVAKPRRRTWRFRTRRVHSDNPLGLGNSGNSGEYISTTCRHCARVAEGEGGRGRSKKERNVRPWP